MNKCNITVGIPTYNRIEKLLISLEKILQCDPQPNEIIIHIDKGDRTTEKIITQKYPEIKLILSSTRMGPGGGRNKIINAATNNIIASFDDDSYPLDQDYFQRLKILFEKLPNTAVINGAVFHIGESIKPDKYIASINSNFIGCGCAYRRDIFLQTTGYIALPLAYGMEEVDLALRLINLNWNIVNTPWLRVFHKTNLEHHNQPQITAATIANQILLTYLRYPLKLWWVGFYQCSNRIIWLIKNHRLAGILTGIISIPQLILKHQGDRAPISTQALNNYLKYRRKFITIKLPSTANK